MKSSERMLVYWMVILTIVTIVIWLRLDSADFRAARQKAQGPPAHTNQIRRVKSKLPPLGVERTAAVTRTSRRFGPSEELPQDVPLTTEEIETDPQKPAPAQTNARHAFSDISTAVIGPDDGTVIRGFAIFEGPRPYRKKIRMDADPECLKLHPDGFLEDDVIINDNSSLANVFVYIQNGLPAVSYPIPKDPVYLDQQGCLYEPRVFGIQTGQTLIVSNNDPTSYNIHTPGMNNEEWNKTLPAGFPPIKHRFSNPEVALIIRDDIHPWMRAYAGILPHPFFAVTGFNGTYALKRLPPGTFTVVAWHEKYGDITQRVTVAEHEVTDINFTFSAR